MSERGNGGGRRNEQGRQRNRGAAGERRFSVAAPSQRKRRADPARLVAFEVLRAVAEEDAYANLVLPARIRESRLDRRDAAFATELAYGALREQGLYDAVLARCVDRPLPQLDGAVLDALRLGTHQLLSMRVPTHAALDETVGLARAVIGAGPSGLINAVLRKVAARDRDEWVAELLEDLEDGVSRSALEHSHPEWIVRALRQSLAAHGRRADEIEDLLAADNQAPVVNLVALPGLGSLDEALAQGAEPGTLVPGSAYYAGGDVARLESVRGGTTRVQDAGSQLVAWALANAELPGGGRDSVWLDLCAGPGGKAALLAAVAARRGATLTANEPTPHRAELVRRALQAVPEEHWILTVEDGRDYGNADNAGRFDRIMVDAPCSGLGALRRRPESRWRKSPQDIAELTILQGELLDAALSALRPGGVLAYVTCSPHPAETRAVVEDALRRHPDARLLDTGAAADAVCLGGTLGAAHPLDARRPQGGSAEPESSAEPGNGVEPGNTVQLWPHVHRTDAMFLALLTKGAPGIPATED
ncbi:rRNA cytosine-C5-methyltransferase [Zafaria cholistanensis]|uniref:rRNA cytosine-C5-methyltransferase n=1 Tax=Zafaria cholistanensis TaxID=1682741 RepID=A0A5A7NRQ1_9MICC|nr:transcription antitermination factor NusB [Zafaria cholistanensis]GER23490.1 rRNA cytosine-C5-methyltransferase [Zafaria cholistanensis]